MINYLIFVFGLPCFIFIFWFSTQRGQILGAWQRVIDSIYGSKLSGLEKILGGCYLCTANICCFVATILFEMCIGLPVKGFILKIVAIIFTTNITTVLSIFTKRLITKGKDMGD